jgi:hypothetical protein
MKVTYKHLTTLGLATTLLAACSDAPPSTEGKEVAAKTAEGEAGEKGHDHASGEKGHDHTSGEKGHDHASGEGEGEGEGEGGHADMAALPVEKRVAFMSGHVEAGIALYRAGAPDQAAQHLMHPVSETHASERAGIDALGFQPAVFEAVSKALADGRPATELEPQLKQAEANMALMREKAGGDAKTIIEYLMGTVVEEYGVGVTEGKISDPGEYQDAFGFSVVALKVAQQVNDPKAADLTKELEALVALWPKSGPLADSTPTAVSEVSSQTSKVLLALSALP